MNTILNRSGMFHNSPNSLSVFSDWFGKLFSRAPDAPRLSVGITESRCNGNLLTVR
jgi:hypothetical protein